MILENAIKEEELLKEEVVISTKKKRKTSKKVEQAPVPENKINEDVNELTQEELEFKNMIESWRKDYKKIFKNEIDEEIIIWRRLKRGEYKTILNMNFEDEDSKILSKQEEMVKAAVLYPSNIQELIDENAGLATVLSEEILAKSGFAISYTTEI